MGSVESEVETGDPEGAEEEVGEAEAEGDRAEDGGEDGAEENPVEVGADGAVVLDAALPSPVPVPNEAIAGPGNT